MKKIIQLSPDTAENSSGQTIHKGYISQEQIDLSNEGKRVAVWWNTGTNATTYTLIYITAPVFLIKANDFSQKLQARISIGAERPQDTKSLKDLDGDINKAVKQMRNDIGNKFGAENRFAMFPQFGFVHKKDEWVFPKDRDDRLSSITLCKNACIANGMTAITYNVAWWTQMETDYSAAMIEANTTDSGISGAVATKNPLQDEVEKVLRSLVHVIKGNHPEDYKQILRVAGFQKEDQ